MFKSWRIPINKSLGIFVSTTGATGIFIVEVILLLRMRGSRSGVLMKNDVKKEKPTNKYCITNPDKWRKL